MPTLFINLSPAKDSFAFTPKHLNLSNGPIILGSADQTGTQGEPSRESLPHNGWFGPLPTPPPSKKSSNPVEEIYPLSLSAMHAKIWMQGGKVFISDMGAAFKTFVNGACVTNEMELRSGDLLALGSKIPRNRNTPAHITDDQLKPLVAVITIS
ncbi:hypothetical protein DFP72DRAFT_284597 [Ephemerocybe angulata]|uniref:FHA domain-containing protein n=1 Tax=Ephemerocybe angulata TaxID=980116 RepID=A0A8H6M9T9_9AGAR|nr:hypothetical protein DFP72DRAFT_284597 [Tulosesus angulatus]